MAETEFREQEKIHSAHRSPRKENKSQHDRQGVEKGKGREGKGREGGSRDRGHHKELNKKDRTWLLRDS
jgi:hypothetical protein